MCSVLIFIQVQHKLHLHSTIIFLKIQNVTFIFYSSFYPFNSFYSFNIYCASLITHRVTHFLQPINRGQRRGDGILKKNTEYASGCSHSLLSENDFQEKQGIGVRESILQWNLSF